MSSVTHANLMDKVYRRQRHFYDVSREYYLLGRDHMIRSLDAGEGSVLEIGCGTGRNLIDTAEAYPKASLYGIDISSQMLRTANAKTAKAGLQERIRLTRADATDFDAETLFGRPVFDRVFFSYSLSIIPDWPAALALGLSCLAPGGQAHIVDFGGQEGLPRVFRRMLYAWLAKFHVTPIAQEDERILDIMAAHGVTYAPRSMFRGYVWYAQASLPA